MPSLRLIGMDWYKGDAPWTQQGLAKKTSQGSWLIEIARDGRYQFELRRYPREASMPIGATEAVVEVGSVRSQVKLDLSDKKAVLEMDLETGLYDMKTTFRDE